MEVQATTNATYLSAQQSDPRAQALQLQKTQPAEDSQQNTPDSIAAKPAAQPTDQVKLSSSVTVKNLDTVKAIEQMHAHMNQLVKGRAKRMNL